MMRIMPHFGMGFMIPDLPAIVWRIAARSRHAPGDCFARRWPLFWGGNPGPSGSRRVIPCGSRAVLSSSDRRLRTSRNRERSSRIPVNAKGSPPAGILASVGSDRRPSPRRARCGIATVNRPAVSSRVAPIGDPSGGPLSGATPSDPNSGNHDGILFGHLFAGTPKASRGFIREKRPIVVPRPAFSTRALRPESRPRMPDGPPPVSSYP